MAPRSRSPAPLDTLALAHALRTPLTSLSLGLGVLRDGAAGPLSEVQADIIRGLASDVDRLMLLVERQMKTDHLGAYAGPVERITLDLASLVRSAATPLESQADERGVALVYELEPSCVVADPVKLAWVIGSLLGNAIRFSPRGGAVEVRTVELDQEVELSIRDEGPGIGAKAQVCLFDRSGGTALFLVREIVEAHGGHVGVSSEPGLGSTFTFTLPVAEAGRRAST